MKAEANDWYANDAYVRKVNLDAMWSREASTVASALNALDRAR